MIWVLIHSRASATNCARVYNQDDLERDRSSRPPKWPVAWTLDAERVFEALILSWVWSYVSDQKRVLELPHDEDSQAARLRVIMHERNRAYAGSGHPDWNHACDLCCWKYQDPVSKEYSQCFLCIWCATCAHALSEPIRSFVTDGITIGHPCCGVQDCQHPLPSKKGARYCTALHDNLNSKCSVNSCTVPATSGFKTCENPLHRKLETFKDLQGKATFQLRERLTRLKVSHVHDALASDQSAAADPGESESLAEGALGDDEWEEVDPSMLPDSDSGLCMVLCLRF
jgi:hypothetical protein